jgi:hypothetical protein
MLRKLSAFSLCLLVGTPLLLSGQDTKRGRKYTPGVIFHPIKDGKDQGNMELKTNEEGKAVLDVVPVGDTVRLQIIASGFQTYGADYQIDAATKEIDVKLLRPGRQYSIYEKHDDSQIGGKDEAPKPSDQNTQPH